MTDRNVTWNSKGQDLLVTDINGSPHDRLKCMIKPMCVHMPAYMYVFNKVDSTKQQDKKGEDDDECEMLHSVH